MIFVQNKRDKLLGGIYVPSTTIWYARLRLSLSVIFIFVLISPQSLVNYAKSELYQVPHRYHEHYIAPSPTFQPDIELDPTNKFINRATYNEKLQDSTPAIETDRIIENSKNKISKPMVYAIGRNKRWISPNKLSEIASSPFEPEDLFSPIFEQRNEFNEHHQQERDAQFGRMPNAQSDSNLMDLVEPGSGGGWDQAPIETTLSGEYSIHPNRVQQNSISTPRFGSDSTSDLSDQPPSLMRRLPVLVATAGQQWRYTIPSDTFEDEDGPMRKLHTNLEFRQSDEARTSSNSIPDNNNQYMHWLQYDQQAQTLYGYPTTSDVGGHNYELIVSDRLGQTSNLTIEVMVHQHPSIRAFSHTFSLVNIEWDRQKYSSLVKALMDIAKRITEGIYSDVTTKNFVIHSYQFQNTSNTNIADSSLSPMTIMWSNSSIPIYPCNSSQLDFILKNLVEEQFYSPNQTAVQDGTSSFTPSQNLRRALEPGFRLMRVDFSLQGSCRNAILGSQPTESDLTQSNEEPIVRTRIQRLQWRLGQPFVFKIPENTFVIENNPNKTSNLTVSIHTIDGIPLEDNPQYNYMEFDQESGTLFGLPYDVNLHTGQRELLLTARYQSPSNHRIARDVMVVDIIAPELTVVNNRAFNMSLYFISRVNSFTPRMRVNLSRKIIQSLGVGDLDFTATQGNIEFVAIELKKFQMDSQLSSFIDQTNLWAYHDKIRRIDDSLGVDQKEYQGPGENSAMFKLTWTNESIGHRGDCPVEVITENVVGSLERNMFEYDPPDDKFDDPTKNDSVRFYERLRAYFEPDIDLIFLSIGPMEGSACANTLGYYDVGNSDLADLVNWADLSASTGSAQDTIDLPITIHASKSGEESKTTRPMINSDEYWSIVVLIILVVALIFVVMMFFMGMHTYRINQEKRFELQIKLAQARQNSMYLSSMMLADQMPFQNTVNQYGIQQGMGEPMSAEDGTSRKPVILDSEKQLWLNGHTDMMMYKPTAVQLRGRTIQTTSLRPDMTFTLDNIAGTQNHLQTNQGFLDDRKRSMTLNRRATTESQQSRMMARQVSMNQLNHSQSISTVSSLSGPFQFSPHQGIPTIQMYAPLPVVCESSEMTSHQA